jgi:2-keto-4-pentenoate hydratase
MNNAGTAESSGGNDESSVDVFAREITQIFHYHRLTRKSIIDIQTLSIDEAYAVQEKYLAARIAVGERPIGYKVGCTSPAIRAQFGLSQPIHGRLLAPHLHHDGDTLYIYDYVDCALEAELVFRIGMDLDGSNLEPAVLRSAISAVYPGIEVHNYRFWYGSPTSQELIASNGLHAALVIGAAQDLPPDVDLREVQMTLTVNQVEASSGFGSDLMDGGGPLESLRWLLNHLKEQNLGLRAGDYVIPGTATKLVPVNAGDIAEARFTHFGVCRAIFHSSRVS